MPGLSVVKDDDVIYGGLLERPLPNDSDTFGCCTMGDEEMASKKGDLQ
jgi:hypothetical protein